MWSSCDISSHSFVVFFSLALSGRLVELEKRVVFPAEQVIIELLGGLSPCPIHHHDLCDCLRLLMLHNLSMFVRLPILYILLLRYSVFHITRIFFISIASCILQQDQRDSI